tara:strand:+ start:194 stop:550 length:357 start_codon:yes stop_codon:yes gene_type:complete
MDIENIDDNTNAEDSMVAGLTLWLRSLFEDWAKDFKQSLFEMIDEVISENGIVADMKLDIAKLFEGSDEAVSAAQMHEAIGNIETEGDEGTLASLVNAQGSMETLMTDIKTLFSDSGY